MPRNLFRITVASAAWTALASSCAHRAPDSADGTGPIDFQIEKPAMAISSNPRPRYPAELVPTGDTGTVRIRVAVEKNGVADMKSVIVVASPHPAFTREVLKVLPGYRFIPAEVGGTLTGGCQVAPSGVEMCKPGRPGKKLRMDVEMDFVFVVPPT